MMAISNKISWYGLSDGAIIKELAAYLKKERIQKNMTQLELAEKSGLDRSTISQIENGRISTLLSFIQILRALDQLEVLNLFQAKAQISPIQMLKAEQRQRLRARRSNINDDKGASSW
jgi:transcriptional regulator with XRE-family HTH domain